MAVPHLTRCLALPGRPKCGWPNQIASSPKHVDEQLDECDITLRDLHLITESLVRTLLSKYHRRIEYPELETVEEKIANGH